MSNKERLDVLLVDHQLFDSREKAKRAIMAGTVLVDGLMVDKPGTEVPKAAEIVLKTNPIPYVSRGGLKLEKALRVFNIDVQGAVAVDIGASTGGFTDCLLQNGAAKVYAIDVGYGQLAWSLRTDSRVVNIERTNIRYLDVAAIPDKADIVTVDTAFISVTKFSNKIKELLKQGGLAVILIKPQFEAGPDKVGKKGVVRDAQTHSAVIHSVVSHYVNNHFNLLGLDYSPIKGPEGNIEFLSYLQLSTDDMPVQKLPSLSLDVDKVVADAHTDHNVS
jgi:23S rRNA (cytidine1920-2'-O)/16S rRNA (cytidine1409-2'-O)-methyltransferase